MPRQRLHGETQKRRQKGQTAQLKRSQSARRVEATHAPAPFERAEPPDRQDLEFLEAMRALRVQPNRRRAVPPRRLREVERVQIEEPAEARSDFLDAMARLGVRPLRQDIEPRRGERANGKGARGAAPAGAESTPAPRPQGGRATEQGDRAAMAAPAPAQGSGAARPSAALAAPKPPSAPKPQPTPEPVRFDQGGASMAELLKAGFDPRGKYDGAPAPEMRRPAWARGAEPDAEPDDQLDLHGKTQEEAIRMVQNFLLAAQKRKLRNVLVITGRGLRSGEQGPVLREAVRRWLERNGGRFLREFRNAPGRHGGAGAFWIEMK